jgi:multidrug efflux pump subunit AcrA (membrane-fusion protein)
VSDAAGALRDIEPRLRDLETQANAIDIFGSRPVAPLGQLFGQIAGDISGLDEQLDGIAAELGRNEAALTANAESLTALARLARAYTERLKPAAIDAGIDEARRLLLITLGLFIGWTAVPAVGALVVGRWMRRLVELETAPPT